MKDGSLQQMVNSSGCDWVLLRLALGFDEARQSGEVVPHTEHDVPVVPSTFDPYAHNIIAPDHCVAGITKSLIKVCFDELNKSEKYKLDRLLTTTISKLGITGQSSLYNNNTKSVNSVSMSTLFTILAVIPHVLSAANFSGKLGCFNTVREFSKLVCQMYWWPTSREDDEQSFAYVHSSNTYYCDLEEQLDKFINALHSYYETNETNASEIDKPNVHRVIELVTNTIPTFGHCALFAELPFESYHQCLKGNISRNTTSSAHLSAMKHVLFMDWLRRISMEISMIPAGADNEPDYFPLVRKLIPNGLYVFHHDFADKFVELKRTLVAHVRNELIGTISSFLSTHFFSTFYTKSEDLEWFWTAGAGRIERMIDLPDKNKLTDKGHELLRSVLAGHSSFRTTSSPVLSRANYVKLERRVTNGSQEQLQTNSKLHQCVTTGDVVRVVCTKGTGRNVVVDTLNSMQKAELPHEASFFIVLNIYQVSGSKFWAVTKHLTSGNNDSEFTFSLSTRNLQVFQFTDTVAKCAVIHNCAKSNSCSIGQGSRAVKHKLRKKDDNHIFVLTGKSGFPFRTS